MSKAQLLIVACVLGFIHESMAGTDQALTSEQIREIQMMVDNGIVRIDSQTNRVILSFDLLKSLDSESRLQILSFEDRIVCNEKF